MIGAVQTNNWEIIVLGLLPSLELLNDQGACAAVELCSAARGKGL
jgi:hypothetical protein